jgi:regulator of sigma E protease
MTTLLATVFVLGILVFIHELGHFLSAKLFKIRVERFSLGYPPRLFGKKVGETDYCISAVPFGGYVKIAGMVDESMDKAQLEEEPKPWEFRSRPWRQKFWVIFAGPFMNVLLAFMIYASGILIYGIGEVKAPVVAEVMEGKPANRAGIRSGDRIISVNDEKVETWDRLSGIIHASAGKKLRLEWTRHDSVFSGDLVPVKEKTIIKGDIREVGLIGISPQTQVRRASVFEALSGGATTVYYLTKLVFVSLGKLFSGQESVRSLAGPVFIAKMAGESARSGFSVLFGFMALISLNLGILNLLPFPVLDGGHILIFSIESLIKREISIKTKMVIQQIGMVFLIGLMLLATYNDIIRIFHK